MESLSQFLETLLLLGSMQHEGEAAQSPELGDAERVCSQNDVTCLSIFLVLMTSPLTYFN